MTFHKSKINRTLPALNLLELVVAVAFIAIIFTQGFGVFTLSLQVVDRARQSTMAELLVQDMLELAISKRNEGWTSLEVGTYHFIEDPDPAVGWVFAAGPETVGEFSRSLTISEVQRDAGGNIVAAGGTVDPNTFLLEAVTTWTSQAFPEEIRLYQYITDWDSF